MIVAQLQSLWLHLNRDYYWKNCTVQLYNFALALIARDIFRFDFFVYTEVLLVGEGFVLSHAAIIRFAMCETVVSTINPLPACTVQVEFNSCVLPLYF